MIPVITNSYQSLYQLLFKKPKNIHSIQLKGAVVVYSLEYWPVVHDVAGSIPANLMDGEWKTVVENLQA